MPRGYWESFIKRSKCLCNFSTLSLLLLALLQLVWLGDAGNKSTMTYGIIPSRPPCSHSRPTTQKAPEPHLPAKGKCGHRGNSVAGWISHST
ncbi:hypothetical protein F4774DRAFT_174993 [Daldinia eschscholtzii]|nr:hypothetical protein F4774DRAFT_174993 [Daldinia eschscholtzii]